MNMYHARVLQFPCYQPMHGNANKEGIMIKGTFFQNYRGKKIVKIELNGEFFTVHFSDGEILEKINLAELNHVVVSATGR